MDSLPRGMATLEPVPAAREPLPGRIERAHGRSGLADQVRAIVRREVGARVADLSVELVDDQIILRGRAGRFFVKQLAQHAAMRAARQVPVVNRIVVN